MSSEKKTVTIGIPAYNESKNIRALLKSLSQQREVGFRLEKIVVVSDGSKESLFHEVNAVSDKRIELIQYMQRRGKPYRLQEIAGQNTSDVFVAIDADVLPVDQDFLTRLVEPFNSQENVGIVGGAIVPVKPESLLERVIYASALFKKRLYEKLHHQDSVYLCHGRVRAFSKEFLSVFEWANMICEDAYSYLYCKKAGYDFVYSEKAAVYYRVPQTMNDHLKQSLRYHSGRSYLQEIFGSESVRKAFHIPRFQLGSELIRFMIRRPHYAVSYLFVIAYTRIVFLWQKRTSVVWDVSLTSKYIIKEA